MKNELTQVDENKDNWSDHWAVYARSASENPAQLMRHQLILDRIKKIGSKLGLLLDIGSGQGDFLAKAVSAGVADYAVGFELSDTGVMISRKKVPEASFYQVDLYSPSAEVRVFAEQADVVVCSDVIEHVDDPVTFCRLILGYMKPGATLVLTVPGGGMSAFDRHIGHRTHYTRETVSNVLRDAGFTCDQVSMAGFPFFNLYRLVVMMRGKRLIRDVAGSEYEGSGGALARSIMRIFRALFRLNLNDSAWGWQVVAVARRPE
jgi:2-polyprenyl-3-methyl-5-hydroxy-6-metoxy-1,4-benzoquinol methylase